MSTGSFEHYHTEEVATLARHRYDRTQLENQATALLRARRSGESPLMTGEQEHNARTALFEELTASGHLSHIEYAGDAEAVNQQVLNRLLNGYHPGVPNWELERRFAEIVEELTVHQLYEDIASGDMPEDIAVLTISDYADTAPNDIAAHKAGYRFINRKGMVRTNHFERQSDGSFRRVLEQVSRSNSTDGSSQWLVAELTDLETENMNSTHILGEQLLVERAAFPEGVVDVQRTLDSYNGNDLRTRYGEATPNRRTAEYEQLRTVSAEREARLGQFVLRLANYEADLDGRLSLGQLTHEQKLWLYGQYRSQLVDEICLLDSSYAVDARGELSAKYFERAGVAMAAGDHTVALIHLESARRSANIYASAVCGGNGQTDTAATVDIYKNALEGRRDWVWKPGLCAVKTCSSRPKKTEVGPCNVCRSCQDQFDAGKDPTKKTI